MLIYVEIGFPVYSWNGQYCWYNNDSVAYDLRYGKLFNRLVIQDSVIFVQSDGVFPVARTGVYLLNFREDRESLGES